MAEILTIGDIRVHRLPEVAYHIKYKGKIKVDKKVADGAGDATTTVKGREVRELTIALSWPDIPRINRIMGPILKALDPAGPDGGKPFDFAHERNGLDLGDIKAVRSILIEASTGPDTEPGSGVNTIEYECGSWSKETASTPAGKTPGEADKQKFDTTATAPVDPKAATAAAQPKPDVTP